MSHLPPKARRTRSHGSEGRSRDSGSPRQRNGANRHFAHSRFRSLFRPVTLAAQGFFVLVALGLPQSAQRSWGILEMVGTIVHQLTRNLTEEQIKEAGFEAYFVDHTTGVFPQFASGYPWSASDHAGHGRYHRRPHRGPRRRAEGARDLRQHPAPFRRSRRQRRHQVPACARDRALPALRRSKAYKMESYQKSC